MAAARQTIAIGILLWLVAEWDKSSIWKRIGLVALASMFHTSAIGFLIFVFLGIRGNPIVRTLGLIAACAGILFFLRNSGQADYYDELYVTGQTSATRSSGAIFHVLLNGGPALIALISGPRVRRALIPNDLHRNMAIAAVLLIPLSLVVSAASGRLTLYLFPVSMWIFSAIVTLFVKSDRLLVRSMLSVFFVGLLAFWLTFGNSATAHRQYENALLVESHELWLCCR
jgi:hypothetical protein